MPLVRFIPEDSVLLVVDVQPTFMAGIFEGDRVQARTRFLAQVARLLEIPVLASEQNVDRMGVTDLEIAAHLDAVFPKMAFSCAGCEPLMHHLLRLGRRQVALVGIETHICVCQTAIDLTEQGFEVAVCPDGVSARSLERHKLGMERIRDSGVLPIHTEALAYEWMRTAEHPRFRDVLRLVKEFA